MATYDVELRLSNGATHTVRIEDAESGFAARAEAEMSLVTGSRVTLIAGRCELCLDSGIELPPLGRRRLICECEHGTELLRNRGPEHFTVKADPERELEGVGC